MKLGTTLLLTIISIPALSLSVMAQAPAPGGNGGGRGTPEEFRKRMEERTKTSLKATDDEWAVLQPLIENVMTKQREARGGGFGGFGGGRPRGGGDAGGAPATAGAPGQGGPGGGGSQQSQDLRAVLEKDGATPDEIKAKLTAFRDSKKKAQADLEQARAELKKVLTARQEAVLVSMGMLE